MRAKVAEWIFSLAVSTCCFLYCIYISTWNLYLLISFVNTKQREILNSTATINWHIQTRIKFQICSIFFTHLNHRPRKYNFSIIKQNINAFSPKVVASFCNKWSTINCNILFKFDYWNYSGYSDYWSRLFNAKHRRITYLLSPFLPVSFIGPSSFTFFNTPFTRRCFSII